MRRNEMKLKITTAAAIALTILYMLGIFGRQALPLFAETDHINPASISVTDGDTIRIADERIRIMGMDTPEKGHLAKCTYERELAKQASARLRQIIDQGNIEIERDGTDRYRRTLARVYSDGRDVAGIMIAEGLARPYEGGRREGWCATAPFTRH